MRKVSIVLLSIFMFIVSTSATKASIGDEVKFSKDHVELFQTNLKGNMVTYKIFRDNRNMISEIYIYNSVGEQNHHLLIKEDSVVDIQKETSTTVATIDNFNEQKQTDSNLPTTYATEPKWGGLTSQKKRININSKYRNNVETVTGMILGYAFPGAAIPYATAVLVAENLCNSRSAYTDLQCYYHVAAGCPQYRWYKKYVFYNAKGKAIKTYNMSLKGFVGIRNSPDNPPMCRLYGF